MRYVLMATALTILTANAAQAQDVTIPLNIEKLSAKAVETVNVTVPEAMLQIASKFLSPNDPEQKAVKSLIGGLKGIYVRSFKFAKVAEYSDTDVEALRKQLHAPVWTPMVNVRSAAGGENVDVFFKMEKDKMAGFVVIAAQPLQLTIVNIVGTIDLDQLAALSGQFGIPKIQVNAPRKD